MKGDFFKEQDLVWAYQDQNLSHENSKPDCFYYSDIFV